MSHIQHFVRYAAAFEKAYASDEWSEIGSLFCEDAVYEVQLEAPIGGRFEGRDAILAYFRRVLDGFDRHFATREVELLEGPREEGDSVWVRGSARYTADAVPDLRFELEETVWFDGGQIRRLEDRYDAQTQRALGEYLRTHGAKLGIGH